MTRCNEAWKECKRCNCHGEVALLDSTLQRQAKEIQMLCEALEKAVRWIEPIMDGFNITDRQNDGTPSSRVLVLDPCKQALSAKAGEWR